MSKVWVLSKFDREDEFCEYGHEILGVFKDENAALKEFRSRCEIEMDDYKDDVDDVDDLEIHIWKDNGYKFLISTGDCEDFESTLIVLESQEVNDETSDVVDFEEMENELNLYLCEDDEEDDDDE